MTIQELLSEYDIEFLESGHQHCREGWVQLKNCVFCASENYHLGFNTQLSFFSCWRCGGHNIYSTFSALGIPAHVTRNFLSDVEIPDFKVRVRKGLIEPKGIGPLESQHKKYLESRGFDPEEISRIWGVQGIGLVANLKWRLYIPIFENGQKVSWTTRSISPNAKQRYLSASAEQESINHRHVVYGLDFCQHSIVICEGPADAWAIGPGAGALFGMDYSTAQIRKLAKIPYRFICFDSTPDAQRIASRLAYELSLLPGRTEIVVLDSKDAGEATAREIRLLRKIAKLI